MPTYDSIPKPTTVYDSVSKNAPIRISENSNLRITEGGFFRIIEGFIRWCLNTKPTTTYNNILKP